MSKRDQKTSKAKPPAARARGAAEKASKSPAKKKAKSLPVAAKSSTTKVAAKPQPMKSAAKPAAPTKAPVTKKMSASARTSEIVLPPNYRPSEDEPFMNQKQRVYFRQKLVAWRDEIMRQTKETLAGLHEDSTQHADLADRATSETDRALELRARDRQRKLVSKIDAALARIEDGTYGYCEETGEPIGLKRLDARPIATLSLEAQERHERRERVYRED